MSRCARALKPASSSVTAPMTATADCTGGRQREEHVRAGDQVDAGGHHRGRVDQGADRRRAGHGVGQPGLQRQLRRLAHRAAQQQRRRRDRPAPSRPATAPSARCISSWMCSVPRCVKSRNRPIGQRRVADARDDERLARRAAVGRVPVPEADQQVAAQPHALPAQVEQQQVVGQHQRSASSRRTGSCRRRSGCSPRRSAM